MLIWLLIVGTALAVPALWFACIWFWLGWRERQLLARLESEAEKLLARPSKDWTIEDWWDVQWLLFRAAHTAAWPLPATLRKLKDVYYSRG